MKAQHALAMWAGGDARPVGKSNWIHDRLRARVEARHALAMRMGGDAKLEGAGGCRCTGVQ